MSLEQNMKLEHVTKKKVLSISKKQWMKNRNKTRISDVKISSSKTNPCWMRGHTAASCYIPLVSFSPGSRLERRGCTAACCCAAQLLTSGWIPSPPSISPLVPRKDGRGYLRWAPLKCRQNAVGRDWGGSDHRQVESIGASVMFATGDCRNLTTCLREHSLTGALLEKRKKWSLEWIHSATEINALLGLVLRNRKTPQSRSSKHRTDSLTRVRVLFLFARRGIRAPVAYGANMPEWVLYSMYFSVDFCTPKLKVSL